MPNVALRIELEGTEPPIWREFVVPQQINLRTLHSVIQEVMGWEDAHLYEFECDGRYYGEPDPDFPDDPRLAAAVNAKLTRLLPRIEQDGLRYLYDFGDGWKHRLTLSGSTRADEVGAPAILNGEMACPPEDIGGVMGYEAFKRALRGEQNEHGEMILESLGEAFDHEALNIKQINWRLGRIRQRFQRRR